MMELLLGVVGLFKKPPNYESHRFGIVEEEKKIGQLLLWCVSSNRPAASQAQQSGTRTP